MFHKIWQQENPIILRQTRGFYHISKFEPKLATILDPSSGGTGRRLNKAKNQVN